MRTSSVAFMTLFATATVVSYPSQVPAADVPPGTDAFITPAGGAHIDFGNEALCAGGTLPPLPAGFFGTGSDTFAGLVPLVGVPLGGPLGLADTVVERLETAFLPDPPPVSDTIMIELVQLSLVSTDPITVTYNGGLDPTPFDLTVAPSPNAASPGAMTITQTQSSPVEGTFTSEMCVFVQVTFTETGNPGNQFVLDTGLTGDGVIVANLATPAAWNLIGGDFRAFEGVDHTGPHPEVVPIPIPEIIPAGEDAFVTAYGQATYEFSGLPIPADFFGPGSLPFEGTIYFEGKPLDTLPPGALGAADTLVRRLSDTSPLDLGDAETIPIEILALRLVGIAPVDFGPGGIEHWPAEVCLSQAGQPTGDMTIVRTHADGGRFTTNLPVVPLFRFDDPGGGPPLFLDCGGPDGAGVCDNLVITEVGEPLYWVFLGGGHVDPAAFPRTSFGPGIPFDGDCDQIFAPHETTLLGASSFQAGLDPEGPDWKPNTEAENALNAGQGTHDTFLNTPEDADNDGIPDRCETPPDPHATTMLTRIVFGEPSEIPALPADFFGPGSEPFQGPVFFEGVPIEPETSGDTSTIVQRWYDPVRPEDPVGTSGSTGLEILELHLVSINPITVAFNGGAELRQYHVHVTVSETFRAPTGTLVATKSHDNGGTFQVEFSVQPRLDFEPVTVGAPVTFDTASSLPPIHFQTLGPPTPFVHAVNPALGILVPTGATFVPGVEETVPGDPTSQQPAQMAARSDSGGVIHTVQPPVAPPPGPGFVPPTLTLEKTPDLALRLRWSESCPGAGVDYGIHSGTIGAWYSHHAIDCSDDGADLLEEVPLPPDDRYFLVVPRLFDDEGSYGRDSQGAQRPRGDLICAPNQALGPCPPAGQ